MYPRSFDYSASSTVEDAIQTLQENSDCKVIAGGQSLVPAMKLRLTSPSRLLDIGKIPELKSIAFAEGALRIGATVTHAEIIDSAVVHKNVPVLASAAELIGDVQIRNLGTIGGSLCHADPSGDYFASLFALDATVVLRGPKGTREVPISQFVTGPFSTTINSDELMVEVRVPAQKGSFYTHKFARRKADFALVNLAVIMEEQDKVVRSLRVAVGAQQSVAVRLTSLEASLTGKPFDEAKLRGEVEKASQSLDPLSDMQGGTEYRRKVAQDLVVEGITKLHSGSGRHD